MDRIPDDRSQQPKTCGCALQASVLVDPEVYRRRARVLRALANPARLHILDRLTQGECSVGELTAMVCLDQSTVSKHLQVLRHHGIVDDRREGNMVFYRLLTPCVLDFFSCADQVLGDDSTEGTK